MGWPVHIVAAGGFVEDDHGNLLLVKTYHRGWDVPGGQIEAGESVEEGLLREILEESGIIARVDRLLGLYSNVGQHVWHDGKTEVPTKVLLDFACRYVGGKPTPSEETSEVLWVPKGDALQYVVAPASRFRLEKALAFSGKVTYSAYVTHPEFRILADRSV